MRSFSLIFIDTQLWIYAQKEPDKKRFKKVQEYEKMFEKHQKASEFMQKCVQTAIIGMTYHQLFEIFHNLGFQGNSLPLEYCRTFALKLLDARFIKWYSVEKSHIRDALDRSRTSRIHIWDYLCVIPLIHDLDRIYTCDQHFKDTTFTEFKISIQNPLDYWEII
jgi:predicted nucleic acid-binding protein